MDLDAVVGAFLSVSLQVLLADIHSIVEFFKGKEVDEELRRQLLLLRQLKNKLLLANGVLDDADRQQITKPDVREWLEQLKDAIHNAEDLVDDIKTEAEADCQMGSQVCGFFSSIQRGIQNIIESVDVQSMIQNIKSADVELRIQNIIKSVDDIVEDMNRLGLREGVQIQRSSLNLLAKESGVYERDAEMKTIINFLKSDGGHKFSVMHIVGMGGIGKTTLAQLVYRDVIDGALVLEKPFDITKWITVAELKSDVFGLTKAIYQAINGALDETINETFQVRRKLKKALQGKKFLFILDDVWNVDYQTWNGLQTPFESAANGSKIIVTTRLPNHAKDLVTVDSEVLYLDLLTEADRWLLFSKHAINNVEPSSYPHLEEIGKRIVEKCRRNPLAVKSLACLLQSPLNTKEWDDILPVLRSYYNLPPHLKRCFAYCSIFPKAFRFRKDQLILLWMAEGLLQPHYNALTEKVGEKYFKDLTSRSFFLVYEDEGGISFTMHDLVNDLAKFVSGESCLRLDDNCSGNLTMRTRHISTLAYETSSSSKKLEDLSKNKVLRTLLVLGHGSRSEGMKQYNINPEQLGSMQYLRVLSASQLFFSFGCHVKLLKSIGRLKHLRYLDLSCNEGIKEIPESIGKLWNLQTLLLRFCKNLHQLPESIVNLKHLRYLDLSDTRIEKIPEIFGNLHELRTLNLSHTRIEKIPDTFGNLYNLRTLDLSHTPIEKIPDTFGNLYNLRTLDLSHTPIEKIPGTIFSFLRTLYVCNRRQLQCSIRRAAHIS